MKKIVIRTVMSLAFMTLIFLLSSCTKSILELEENPIILSSEAQVKITHVKNLLSIYSNDPNDEYGLDNGWSFVKSEWLYCYFKRKKNFNEDIKIEVKENTSTESRTIELVIISEVNEDTLIIKQLGKTD